MNRKILLIVVGLALLPIGWQLRPARAAEDCGSVTQLDEMSNGNVYVGLRSDENGAYLSILLADGAVGQQQLQVVSMALNNPSIQLCFTQGEGPRAQSLRAHRLNG